MTTTPASTGKLHAAAQLFLRSSLHGSDLLRRHEDALERAVVHPLGHCVPITPQRGSTCRYCGPHAIAPTTQES